jgi:hypothetical protein
MMGDWSWNQWRPNAYPGVQQHYARYPYAPPLPPKQPEPTNGRAPGPYYVDVYSPDEGYVVLRKEWVATEKSYCRSSSAADAENIAAALNEQAAKAAAK